MAHNPHAPSKASHIKKIICFHNCYANEENACYSDHISKLVLASSPVSHLDSKLISTKMKTGLFEDENYDTFCIWVSISFTFPYA